MQRRAFFRMCAAAALCAPHALAAKDLKPRFYSRSRLVDSAGRALQAKSLAIGRNYVFHYPFEGTPCFLINLGQATGQNVQLRVEDGSAYEWPGGVGPQRALVAYSAICTHRMAYPTRQISFISYRDGSGTSPALRPKTIHCCAEHSQYDPASGARVVGGPAPMPLSAILLEHEAASDGLYAIGTLGGEMFDAFFAKYGMRLDLDYGNGLARQHTGRQSTVVELTTFSKQQVRC